MLRQYSKTIQITISPFYFYRSDSTNAIAGSFDDLADLDGFDEDSDGFTENYPIRLTPIPEETDEEIAKYFED